MFILGHIYRRRDLHDQFGGNRQSGISAPANHPIVLLFTSETGEQYGYKDSWEEGIYHYTGEGRRGHMQYTQGNRRIRDHIIDGRDLHLFTYVKRAHVRYDGQMVCIGGNYLPGTDLDGKPRRVIVFDLVSADEFVYRPSRDDSTGPLITLESMEILWHHSMKIFGGILDTAERKQIIHDLSNSLVRYVFDRANGICEGCNSSAPFNDLVGQPYLEPHYIRRLGDSGPDYPRWVAGVCPNCHKRAHFSEEAESYNSYLEQKVLQEPWWQTAYLV